MRSIPPLAVLLFVSACSTPDRPEEGAPPSASRRAADVVPLAKLPEDHRQVLLDYGRGGATWEARRPQVQADPVLARFLVDNLVFEMVRGYESLAGSGGRRGERAFERAQAELARFHDTSVPVLAGLLALSDGIVATLAAETLERIGPPAAPALLPLLTEPSPGARRRAAELAGRLDFAGGEEERLRAALARCARADPEWTVRAEAAAALGARGARDTGSRGTYGQNGAVWREPIEACLSDPDPSVVEYAARGLALLGDPRAVPALTRAMGRSAAQGHLRCVQACQAALEALSGTRAPQSLEAWEDWWSRNRSRFASSSRGPGSGLIEWASPLPRPCSNGSSAAAKARARSASSSSRKATPTSRPSSPWTAS